MGNKKVLLVVSHGSKRKESNQEFKDFIKKLNEINQKKLQDRQAEELAEKFAEIRMGNKTISYQEVKGACLEFAFPQLETVIKDLIEQGKEEVDILPLFVFAGYHVRQDIPRRMAEIQDEFSQLKYNILDHPAADDNFASYIFKQALKQSFT